jgi:hypothetical protein
MSLDDQLAELLAQLGVVLEAPPPKPQEDGVGAGLGSASADPPTGAQWADTGPAGAASRDATSRAGEADESLRAAAELSLFQTSREHYGVFYRLDLVAGAPQLRIFLPEDEGAVKMACYVVRAGTDTPLQSWFETTLAHDGSPAYDDVRETGLQHLLFTAGELMKRLFWSGEPERMEFPPEIRVVRLL